MHMIEASSCLMRLILWVLCNLAAVQLVLKLRFKGLVTERENLIKTMTYYLESDASTQTKCRAQGRNSIPKREHLTL